MSEHKTSDLALVVASSSPSLSSAVSVPETPVSQLVRKLFLVHIGTALIRHWTFGMPPDVQINIEFMVAAQQQFLENPSDNVAQERLQAYLTLFYIMLSPHYMPGQQSAPTEWEWYEDIISLLKAHTKSTLEEKVTAINVLCEEAKMLLPLVEKSSTAEEYPQRKRSLRNIELEFHRLTASQCYTHALSLQNTHQMLDPLTIAYNHASAAYAIIDADAEGVTDDTILTTTVTLTDLYDILSKRYDAVYYSAKVRLSDALKRDPMAQADYHLKNAGPYQHLQLYEKAIVLHEKARKLVQYTPVSIKRNMLLVVSAMAIGNIWRDRLCGKIYHYPSLMYGDSIFHELDQAKEYYQAGCAALKEGASENLVSFFNQYDPGLNAGTGLVCSIETMAAMCQYWMEMVNTARKSIPRGSPEQRDALTQQERLLQYSHDFFTIAIDILEHYKQHNYPLPIYYNDQYGRHNTTVNIDQKIAAHQQSLVYVSAIRNAIAPQKEKDIETQEQRLLQEQAYYHKLDEVIHSFDTKETHLKTRRPVRKEKPVKTTVPAQAASSTASALEEVADVDEKPKALSLLEQTGVLLQEGRLDRAEKQYNGILKTALSAGNTIDAIHALVGLADIQQVRALEHYKRYDAMPAAARLKNPTALYDSITQSYKAEAHLQHALEQCKEALSQKKTEGLNTAHQVIVFSLSVQHDILHYHQQRLDNLHKTLTDMREKKKHSPGWQKGNSAQPSPAAQTYKECVAQQDRMATLQSWHGTVDKIHQKMGEILQSDILLKTGAGNNQLKKLFAYLPRKPQEDPKPEATVNAYIAQALAHKGPQKGR